MWNIYIYWSLVGEPNGKYSVRGVCVDGGEIREWTWCLGLRPKSFFFFFPQNPADVDGDQLDVSEASLGSTMLEKNFFSRARESSRVSGQFRVKIVVKKNFFAHALSVFSFFPIQ